MPRDRSRRRESRAGPSIQSTQLLDSGLMVLTCPRPVRTAIGERGGQVRISPSVGTVTAVCGDDAVVREVSTGHRRGAGVALGSSAASAEPLSSPMFSEVVPPRPPRGIGRPNSHQPHPASPRGHGRAATAHKPSAAAPAPVNPNVVTTGASAPARAADPTATGSTPSAPNFPPMQIME